MDLTRANIGEEYKVKEIITEDNELNSFLFSLGLYRGEAITLISKVRGIYVVSIKDARYSIDEEIASSILV